MSVDFLVSWNIYSDILGFCFSKTCCPKQVGNRKLMNENGISIAPDVDNFVIELEESAKTGILVACNDDLIGVLGIADPLKREAAVVVEGLVKMGVSPVMVTGDNWRTARAVAKEVGIKFSPYLGPLNTNLEN